MTSSAVAALVAQGLRNGEKSQKEVADELGYERPNIISMFKQGTMKVPLDKIPALARALELEPRRLLRTAMQEYAPDTLMAIEEVHGKLPTKHEREILDFIRSRTARSDPAMGGPKQEALLLAFCKELTHHTEKTGLGLMDDPDYGSW